MRTILVVLLITTIVLALLALILVDGYWLKDTLEVFSLSSFGILLGLSLYYGLSE